MDLDELERMLRESGTGSADDIEQAKVSATDTLEYDPAAKRLHVGEGFIDNVSPAVWDYTVSGKQVLRRWFSYRKKDRKRFDNQVRVRPQQPLTLKRRAGFRTADIAAELIGAAARYKKWPWARCHGHGRHKKPPAPGRGQ